MAFQSDPEQRAESDPGQPADRAPDPTTSLADDTATKGPVPGSDLVAVDPDPAAFADVRIVLVVEAVLLAALGVWGLVADLTERGTGRSGAPVLVFHLTWQHALVLLGTAGLALIGTRGHKWAMRATTVQAVGYGVLFIVGAGQINWFADPADDWLHLGLAIIGFGMLIWTAARAFGDRQWVHKAEVNGRERATS
jgi:hypothetical protein